MNLLCDYFEEKQNCVATLKEFYESVKSSWERDFPTLEQSIRATMYRDKENRFKRINKGLYLYEGAKTSSLLIQGSGRDMHEIDNNTIDGIITDHPWSDKKAHTSGNQKCFAEYETFSYTKEDFDAKYRVLKEGSYLTEFLPIESATNWEYIANLKQLAAKSGFKYYASMIWRKAPEGTINNGRTTKGVEQILIFSKGNPRRIAPKGKPYMTRNMLSFEINIPIKANEKNHQAEKPLELYQYLIENLTEEREVCLDQYAGACNMLKAAADKNRWAICYEISKEMVLKAVNRLKLLTLYESIDEISQDKVSEKEKIITTTLQIIPATSTEFQLIYLNKAIKSRPDLFEKDELMIVEEMDPQKINNLFDKINKKGYSNYERPVFDINIDHYCVLQKLYDQIENQYVLNYEPYTRSFYENVKIEQIAYVEYLVIKKNIDFIDWDYLEEYYDFVKNNFPKVNLNRTIRILNSLR